jgi:hypothetical protein
VGAGGAARAPAGTGGAAGAAAPAAPGKLGTNGLLPPANLQLKTPLANATYINFDLLAIYHQWGKRLHGRRKRTLTDKQLVELSLEHEKYGLQACGTKHKVRPV